MTEFQNVTIERTIEGATIRATILEQLEPMAVSVVEQFVEQRAAWAERLTIWMGWTAFALQSEGNDFVIVTPDLATNPQREVTSDLSLAIWTIIQQTALAEKVGLDPLEVNYNHDVIGTSDWNSGPAYQLSREVVTNPRDSGWFVQPFPSAERAEDWRSDELVRLPAWQLQQTNSALADVMTLPPGVSIIVDDEGVRAIFRDHDGAVLMSRAAG